MLDADDPLRGEWVVAVVGPHFAGAFAARDEGDHADDMERRFTFSVTYERDLVIEIGQSSWDAFKSELLKRERHGCWWSPA
ncbi:MAG: hypothetical protein H0W06_10800 [Chloroflexia bacterium]|nr:hypothetical protein [Chloroflexia bacterium]